MTDLVAQEKPIWTMKSNFEQILRAPIKLFNNKFVLKTTIYSCLILYFLLAIANITYSIFPEFFNRFHLLYSSLKDSVYQVLLLTSLGYFLSKYKFCYWSLLSFYGIVYIKLIWFIDQYIYNFSSYINIVDSLITIITLTMVAYYFYKNHRITLD